VDEQSLAKAIWLQQTKHRQKKCYLRPSNIFYKYFGPVYKNPFGLVNKVQVTYKRGPKFDPRAGGTFFVNIFEGPNFVAYCVLQHIGSLMKTKGSSRK
jgi:hypothetical protein